VRAICWAGEFTAHTVRGRVANDSQAILYNCFLVCFFCYDEPDRKNKEVARSDNFRFNFYYS
jgi:hypothetical protein